MHDARFGPRFESNPLLDDSPDVWDELVEALAPATMLVAIRHRMGSRIASQVTAEDVWQDTLMHVWRDRSKCEWRGLAAFRRWVLSVAENRIRNESDRIGAQRRGEGVAPRSLETDRPGALPPPVASTTPSRVASFAEEAELMRDALELLPEELRDVVRMRHFDERSVEEIAEALSLGASAVKHRFRKGASLYQRHVQELLEGGRDA